MITLHGFQSNFEVKDPSPFVLKVDTYMRMTNIEFTTTTDFKNLKRAPKGKLPFINDDGFVISDSQLIIEYLQKTYGNKIDDHLTIKQKATAYLFTKSLDENLYFCLVYSRWLRDDTWPIIKKAFFGNMPILLRNIVPNMIRKSVSKGLKGQGIGRHSNDEIMHIARMSFQALSDFLGDNDFMFGDKVSTFDATCYGFLAQVILVNIDNPYNSMAKEFTNLVNYCNRIKALYY